MTSRRRTPAKPTSSPEKPQPEESSSTAPSKWPKILCLSGILLLPYAYLLLFHFNIDAQLKRSILINAALSVAGYMLTIKLIPVASRYVIRRNLFGFDINKRGTPQGLIKVSESLGIVIGIVFLLVAILFQHFNFTADSVELEKSKPVILTRDLNCAHQEIDIYNPAGNKRSSGFTIEERESFENNFLSKGFVDTFRKQHPDVVGYTYWGYRHGGRKTNRGWRLDYFLVSESLADRVHDSYILPDVVGSDHCPIGLVLKQ